MQLMRPDYGKRDYLLPSGCKDLIDVLKLSAHQARPKPWRPKPLTFPPGAALTGEMIIPARATVLHLAMLLKKKPVRIVFDLLEMEIYAPITHELDFDTMAAIAQKYGYIARKAG
jgi:hypothetical protein